MIFAYMFVPDTYHLLGIRRMHWGCLYFLFPEMIDSRHYITPSVGKGPLIMILYRPKRPLIAQDIGVMSPPSIITVAMTCYNERYDSVCYGGFRYKYYAL